MDINEELQKFEEIQEKRNAEIKVLEDRLKEKKERFAYLENESCRVMEELSLSSLQSYRSEIENVNKEIVDISNILNAINRSASAVPEDVYKTTMNQYETEVNSQLAEEYNNILRELKVVFDKLKAFKEKEIELESNLVYLRTYKPSSIPTHMFNGSLTYGIHSIMCDLRDMINEL